ncbi:MAG TPA: ROK family protein [Erysipelotrichaceae bacterium]|nr:ROK family protein [Erysipelotrichaceae bacterium]
MKTYIGIDLGGTLVRVAKVTATGEILHEAKSDSYAQSGPEIVLDNIVKLVKSIPNYKDCEGIGMGIPGPVDTVKGYISMATNLVGFEKYPVVEKLEKDLGLKVFLDNDANVAGLAEAKVGAGKDLAIVYYLTHSTGIGGALVVNGRVVSGKSGYAGEVANIVVCESSEKINHLTPGAVENEAGGTSLVRRAKTLVDPEITDASQIFDMAREGNEKALDLIDDMARKFALMMANIGHVVDPHMFIIGGGITKAADMYLDKVEEYYKSFVHKGMREIDIKLAELAEPGVVGAAMLPISFGL